MLPTNRRFVSGVSTLFFVLGSALAAGPALADEPASESAQNAEESSEPAAEDEASSGESDDEASSNETGEPSTEGDRESSNYADQSADTGGDTTGSEPKDAAGAPSWQTFQSAFEALADGDAERSARSLVRLRDTYPDTTAALFARPVLDALRDRPAVPEDLIPPSASRPPADKHPAVQNRDSAVYDPMWVRYREAFTSLAARDRETARTKLGKVSNAAHPAARFAAVILDRLSSSSSGQTAAARDDTSSGDDQTSGEAEDPNVSQSADNGDSASESGSTVGRILGNSLGGFGGLFVGGLGGGLVGFVAGIPLASGAGRYAGVVILGVAFLGGALGGVALAPLGAYLGGNMGGGNGSIFTTYAGGLLGAAGSIALTFVRPYTPALLIPQLILPVAGSVAGYELSHALATDETAALEPTIRPVVGAPPRAGASPQFGFNIRF